jgi:CheY-like chemotaxis protein
MTYAGSTVEIEGIMKPTLRRNRALRTALVVDDDETNRKLISAILRRERFLVSWASDGAGAISSIDAASFSVIVLDLAMPDVSGQEVINHLKKTRPDALRRVIVLTALDDIDVPPEQVFAVMRKPFEFDRFVRAICECADQSDAPGEAIASAMR